MPLASGQSLTHYEILGAIGAGGMGEVYRARDTRLDREVAIKVLPEAFVDDEDRLRRFEREAKTLATLHHPNVASIFGIDQVDETCFLALELVEGEELAEALERGPLPLDEALDVCRQIAEGLEAAHEAGVVHRDLKPANVKITPQGVVKVLDFGLAKPVREAASGTSVTAKPDSFLVTEEGMVLGTPTYMSPEQARAKPVDRRTDIWAFGCVLYECLTGERAFRGEAVADVLGAILSAEPDYARLPADTPPRVRELLRRCLEKVPIQRLRDIGEARLVLERPREGGAMLVPARAPRGRAGWLVAGVAGVLALTLLAAEMLEPESASRPRRPTSFVLEQTLASPGYWGGNMVAVSADGRFIAFVGVPGDSRIFLRPLDAFEAQPLPGTENARSPFFSHDGAWLGFWADGTLQKVSTSGGPTTAIATVPAVNSAAWSQDDRIVAAETVGSLRSIDVKSGEVTRLTDAGEGTHHDSPDFVSGGEWILFEDAFSVGVADASDGSFHLLGFDGEEPRWAPTGHILYQRGDSTLWAMPFDPETREPTGDPFLAWPQPVLDFDLSDEGTLVFVPGRAHPLGELTWVDRGGRATPLEFDEDRYLIPRVSPTGGEIAVSVMEHAGDRTNIWILDLERRSRSRLTSARTWNVWAVWTHDATRIQFLTDGSIWSALADGSGEPAMVLEQANMDVPMSWNEELQALAYYNYGQASDLWIWHADGEVEEYLATPFDERAPCFSPDGRWIAYVSNPSGLDEVYVRPYARGEAPGSRISVSTGGGIEPRWSSDGSELYYRRRTELYAVSFDAGPPAKAGAPELLFDEPFHLSPVGRGNPNYDVAPDGRFLMIRNDEAEVTPRVHVVRDWAPEPPVTDR